MSSPHTRLFLTICIAVCTITVLSPPGSHAAAYSTNDSTSSDSPHPFGGWAHPGGGFLVPLAVRQGSVRARRSLLRSGSLPVFGSVRDIGYFYAQLSLGYPVRKFSLIIDTGSTITYVPCTTCVQCGHHEDEAFNPQKSTTALALTCDHADCKCGSPSCQCKDKMCYYSRAYAERSSSEGWLLQDQLLFPDGKDPTRLVFGCENKETGEIFKQKADGILGMGNDAISFHGQLAKQRVIDDVFGLCFGYPSNGAMLLGDIPLPAGLDVKYTPLVTSLYGRAYNAQFYTVEVTAMSVDGQNLPVPQMVYASGYGAVMDSGTTFTYVPPEAFRAFVEAVSHAVEAKGLKKVPGADPQYADICWGGAPKDIKQLGSVFPQAAMHFGGGVVLQLPPLRYLFTTGAGTYCLGMFENEQPGGTLIGGISVRDVLIIYDRRNSRIGFAPTSCASLQDGVAKASSTAASGQSRTSSPSPPQAAAASSGGSGGGDSSGKGGGGARQPLQQRAAPVAKRRPGLPAPAALVDTGSSSPNSSQSIGRRGQAPVAVAAPAQRPISRQPHEVRVVTTPRQRPADASAGSRLPPPELTEVEQSQSGGQQEGPEPGAGAGQHSTGIRAAAPTRSGMATPPPARRAPRSSPDVAEAPESGDAATSLSWQSWSASLPAFVTEPQHYTLYIVLAGLAVLPAALILDATFHEGGPTRRWAAAARAQWQGYSRATATAGQ